MADRLCLGIPKPNVQMLEEVKMKVKPTKLELQLKKALARIRQLESIADERAQLIEKIEMEKIDLEDRLVAMTAEHDMYEDELEALRAGKTL